MNKPLCPYCDEYQMPPRWSELETEVVRQREQIKVLREALESVVYWRNSAEGPEILFPIGAKMSALVRAALAKVSGEG